MKKLTALLVALAAIGFPLVVAAQRPTPARPSTGARPQPAASGRPVVAASSASAPAASSAAPPAAPSAAPAPTASAEHAEQPTYAQCLKVCVDAHVAGTLDAAGAKACSKACSANYGTH